MSQLDMREKSSDLKCFRERTDELMSQLDKHDIPVLILSAGLGDLIHEVLQQHKVIFFQCIPVLTIRYVRFVLKLK
jgi:hypothetical protein